MWMQVHEMLYIERGGEEQIAGELEAYNPLVPRGDALIATMTAWRSTIRRAGSARALSDLAGIEDTIKLEVAAGPPSPLSAIEGRGRAGRPKTARPPRSIVLRFPFQPATAAGVFRAAGTRVPARHRAPGLRPSRGHAGRKPRAALAEDLDDGV